MKLKNIYDLTFYSWVICFRPYFVKVRRSGLGLQFSFRLGLGLGLKVRAGPTVQARFLNSLGSRILTAVQLLPQHLPSYRILMFSFVQGGFDPYIHILSNSRFVVFVISSYTGIFNVKCACTERERERPLTCSNQIIHNC